MTSGYFSGKDLRPFFLGIGLTFSASKSCFRLREARMDLEEVSKPRLLWNAQLVSARISSTTDSQKKIVSWEIQHPFFLKNYEKFCFKWYDGIVDKPGKVWVACCCWGPSSLAQQESAARCASGRHGSSFRNQHFPFSSEQESAQTLEQLGLLTAKNRRILTILGLSWMITSDKRFQKLSESAPHSALAWIAHDMFPVWRVFQLWVSDKYVAAGFLEETLGL